EQGGSTGSALPRKARPACRSASPPLIHTAPCAPSRSETAQGDGRGQRRLRGLAALVLLGAGQSGSGDGLLLVVAGEQAEPDGGPGVERHARETVGRGR